MSIASYSWQVSSGRPSSNTYWYAPCAHPPQHEPAILVPQLRMTWMERLMSGNTAFRRILMRSASALIEPWAQHEPQ